MEKDREFCLSILQEYTKSDSLLKHAYSVEACVRAYAVKYEEDENYWGNVALLHDFDYEMYPNMEDHPSKGSEILREKGFTDDFRRAILSHADHMNVPRESKLEKVLYACDELAGFIIAQFLMFSLSFITFNSNSPFYLFMKNGHLCFKTNLMDFAFNGLVIFLFTITGAFLPSFKASKLKPAYALGMGK